MKTLKNHILFYDEQCPMCSIYTKGFVSAKMMDENSREAYQKLNIDDSRLDKQRARNEIALLNKETGEVTYGVESLFKIISNSFPLFSPLFRFAPFKWMMKQVYFFISYNRKVIVPSKFECDSCVPDLNITFRWIYIIFAWLITSMILTDYSYYLKGIIPSTEFYREFLICGGQIIFQTILIRIIAKGKILDYLGNMMTISLVAALVLWIGSGIISIFSNEPFIFLGLFMGVVGLMLLEHLRRMKLLKISILASLGWVMYRILVLFIIL